MRRKRKRAMGPPTHKEEWLPVTGYEGYYWVSNMGQVKSRDQVMRQTKHGYCKVDLSRGGVKKRFSVHRLVMASFVGEAEGMVVDHIDGDVRNNNLDNLEYVTHSENALRGRAGDLKEDKHSQYRGVSKKSGRWIAYRRLNGRRVWIGSFATEYEAHQAYVKENIYVK